MSSEPGQLAPRGLDVPILALAVVLGATVRLIPVLSADFPLNDGGLFATMIEDLVRNGFVPPEAVSYNAGDIPFAYPPLGFYLGALPVAIGLPVTDVLRLLPLVLSVLTIPAWFLLARELIGPRLGAVAALFFALLPRSYEWLISGGGLTRSLGLLLALLALWAGVRYLRGAPMRVGVLAGVLTGLTAISHPEAAVLAAASLVLLAVVDRSPIRHLLIVGATALVTAAPWVAFVVATYGVDPLLAASSSRLTAYLPVGLRVLELRFTQEAILALGAILGVIGLFIAATSKRGWLVAWFAVIFLAVPGAAATYLMLPLSAGAAIAVVEFVFPRFAPRHRPLVAAVGGGWLVVSSVWTANLPESVLLAVPAEVRDAMSWADAELGEDAVIVVATGAPWAADAVAEWYPHLTRQVSAATVQGTEFTEVWAVARQQALDLAECARRSYECVVELIAESWPEADALFIPTSRVPGVSQADCCAALLEGARRGAVVLYDGAGALIVQLRP